MPRRAKATEATKEGKGAPTIYGRMLITDMCAESRGVKLTKNLPDVPLNWIAQMIHRMPHDTKPIKECRYGQNKQDFHNSHVKKPALGLALESANPPQGELIRLLTFGQYHSFMALASVPAIYCAPCPGYPPAVHTAPAAFLPLPCECVNR